VTERPVKVAALAAIPVFYQVPLYRRLAADPRIDLTVIYSSSAGVRPYDGGYGGEPIVWDVDLLSGYRSEFLPGADEIEPLDGFLALRQPAVLRRIFGGGFDVVWVHGYSQLFLWFAMAAAAARRARVLVREEQTLLYRRPWPKRWFRAAVLRSLFPHIGALYIGSNNRDFFAAYGVRSDDLYFVPYCVDNEALREEAELLRPRRADLRARFGVHDDRPIILFVGRLMDKKQPFVLLDAFRRVREQMPCALVFVGEGPLGQELRERAGSVPDVNFAGFLSRSEIAGAYAAADVFALSSRRETWGLAVNEAMNFSLPVVVSDKVGSARDLARPGDNGFIVPHGDTAAFAVALGALVADADLRLRYGARSLEIVSEFSYERAAQGVIAACQDTALRAKVA
jgi:glycosyltransferase involved in cell wall biosynthesis